MVELADESRSGRENPRAGDGNRIDGTRMVWRFAQSPRHDALALRAGRTLAQSARRCLHGALNYLEQAASASSNRFSLTTERSTEPQSDRRRTAVCRFDGQRPARG